MSIKLFFDYIDNQRFYNINEEIFHHGYLLNLMYHYAVDFSIVGREDTIRDGDLCFYIIKPEITENTWFEDESLYDNISNEAKQLHKEGKLVFLVCVETEAFNFFADRYRKVKSFLKNRGIDRVYFVNGAVDDVNNKQYFGIDFWQMHHQVLMNRRLGNVHIPWTGNWLQHDRMLQGDELKGQTPVFQDYQSIFPKKLFLSYNGNARHHRIALMSELTRNGLLDNANYSFTGNGCDALEYLGPWVRRLTNWFSKETEQAHYEYCLEYIKNWKPVKLDVLLYVDTEGRCNLTDDRYYEYQHYAESYFSLVTETYCSDKNNYTTWLTEKTWKPISLYHPFLIWGQPGILAYLRNEGYETFPELFDESYDDESDIRKRRQLVVNNVIKAKELKATGKLDKIIESIYPKLAHNYNLFYNKDHKIKIENLFKRIRETHLQERDLNVRTN